MRIGSVHDRKVAGRDSGFTDLTANGLDHVPFGSYPGNMPFEYFSDEKHLAEWIEAEQSEDTFKAFLDHYIFGVDDFETYLALAAGDARLAELRRLEILKRDGG